MIQLWLLSPHLHKTLEKSFRCLHQLRLYLVTKSLKPVPLTLSGLSPLLLFSLLGIHLPCHILYSQPAKEADPQSREQGQRFPGTFTGLHPPEPPFETGFGGPWLPTGMSSISEANLANFSFFHPDVCGCSHVRRGKSGTEQIGSQRLPVES